MPPCAAVAGAPHDAARTRARRWVLAIIAVAAALRIEALWVGLAMDDWAQVAMIRDAYGVARAPWDLFSFCDGSPTEVSRMVDAGLFPWWSDPELRLSTLRPLASVLVWLDVQVFGIDARWHRLHTLVWWIAMLVVVARFLLRVLPTRWALLAFALYALDECHAQPLAWSANRNAILATLFGMLAVHAHVRVREGEGPRWHAAVLLVLAFASGEVALGAVGVLVAYEVTRGSVRPLAGCLAVVVLWAVVHRGLGYGANASGVYVDPTEPIAWLGALVDRGPILLADLAFAVPTGQLALGGRGMALQRALGVVAVLLAVVWLRTRRDDARTRWFALATVLAVIPMTSAFVSARLLVIPAIAAHVLVAAALLACVDRRGAWRGVAYMLGVLHLGLAPWWSMREIADLREFGAAAQRAAVEAPKEIARELVIVPAVADPSTLLYPSLVRAAFDLPTPARWAVLSAAPGAHRLRRIDAHTLELEVDGGMLRTHVEQMFRREGRPFAPVHAWNGAQIEVLDERDGFPTRVRFRFAIALDDPRVAVMLATPRGFVRYPLGPIGSEIAVPPASAPLESATRLTDAGD